MKILLLVDNADSWSAHNRAKAIVKHLPDHEFTIRAESELYPGTTMPNDHKRRTNVRLGKLPRKLWAIRDADSFDAIHFNFTAQVTDYTDFILENRERCIITLINERSYYQGYFVDQPALHRLCRECPHVTSLSPTLARRTGAAYIPNGIDETLFSRPKIPVVGYAGTNAAIKNPLVVEQACRELGMEFRSASYGGRVKKHTLPHEKMQDFYRGLDVYVHASSTEGFNNTVLEALAMNLPVLMTRSGAWKEFEGLVSFIEPTVAGIKRKLRPWCGRHLVLERFLWSQIIPTYGAIYDAINQSGARGISPPTRELCGFAAAEFCGV